jgi:uncharacterized protein (TIGR03437 family)
MNTKLLYYAGLQLLLANLALGVELKWALGSGSHPVRFSNIEGGFQTDSVYAVAVDPQRNIYITGPTYSPVFPASSTIWPLLSWGSRNWHGFFIAKLNPDASQFIYVKLIEGRTVESIVVDPAGNAYVSGPNFVMKLDPSGSNVIYTLTLPASHIRLALDAAGSVYMAGTCGPDFPVTPGAYRTKIACSSAYCTKLFVAKLNYAGTGMTYSALLGGSGTETFAGLAVDSSGSVYVTGRTSSTDFPVSDGAVQREPPPGSYGWPFVAKLNSAGTALSYSTFLSGKDSSFSNAIAVDVSGNAYITGSAYSSDYPTTPGAFRTQQNSQDTFVTKLNASGTEFIYSTLLGARSGQAIFVDSKGNAHVTGFTGAGLPISGAFQSSDSARTCPLYSASGFYPYRYMPCEHDGYVAALNPAGSALIYSTYLNGSTDSSGEAIALDSEEQIIIGGYGALTVASTNPLSNNGGAFVVKLNAPRSPAYFTRESITNGANYVPGLVRPGGFGTIFCANLQGVPESLIVSKLPLPTELAGVSVKIGGIPAPLYSVSGIPGQQQINFQAPFNPVGDSVPYSQDVELSNNGLSAFVAGVNVAATAPGVFTVDGIRGVIQHAADYRLVTLASPVDRGEVVIVYLTGLGNVTPPVSSGVPPPIGFIAVTNQIPSVKIGGQSAEVLFSGLTPGFVGVYQLNLRIPQDVASGDQDLIVSFPSFVSGFTRQAVDSKPVKLAVR